MGPVARAEAMFEAGLTVSSAQQQPSSQPAAPSLFGTVNASQPTTTQTTSSLFGTAGSNNTNQQNTNTSSLFGGANNNTQTTQPALGGSLFGGTSNTTSTTGGGGGLFGSASNTQSTQPATGGGGLFGGASTSNKQTSSLFGGQNQNQGGTSTSLFAKPATTQPAQTSSLFSTNPNAGSSLFNNSTNQSNQNAPSLLGATQAAKQPSAFGRLSMGQGAAAASGQAASQVTHDNLRPTTRFEDCADAVRQELEQIDKMIQTQEGFCKQIEAIMPKHEEDINTLLPDINFVKDKADDVEQSLASDAQGVDARRQHAEKDRKDLDRLSRIVTNLGLPQSYQYPNLSISGLGGMYNSQQRPRQQQTAPEGEDPANYDTDLINNYFLPMTAELQRTLDSYANNLAEIEQHMRVVESSTVTQAQQLAQRRAGISGGLQPNGDETVRELASTLRGFEESILGVAGIVGECREGINELVLGRLGRHPGARVY